MTTTTITRHRPTLGSPRTGPYAPVAYCGDHRLYVKGCTKCRRYYAWHKRSWTRRLEHGERITVPIGEVRAHLDKLTAAGMTPKVLQAVTDLPRSTIAGLLYKPNRRSAAGFVADRILSIPVPATPSTRPRTSHVTDATGSIRRIQALVRIGWTYEHIAAAGQTSQALHHIVRKQRITRETAARVARAYDLLSMKRGPSKRTATRAARKGWLPPLAWDDATIDDPNAKPNIGGTTHTDEYDPITVALGVDGRLTHAQLVQHRPDLIEVVRRLAQRMTDVEIAHHLHWPGCDDGPPGKTRGQNNVGQLRHRHGIPGPERFEAVYAYRPGGRRARNDKAA